MHFGFTKMFKNQIKEKIYDLVSVSSPCRENFVLNFFCISYSTKHFILVGRMKYHLVFIGNINDSVQNIMKISHLFSPFPSQVANDAAFFDRIHYARYI